MIKAKHTIWGVYFFRIYSRIQLKRNFRKIAIHGNYTNTNKSILLIANHFTWWDGFIQLYLNEFVFKRRFHVMMLEEQLSVHKILRSNGAFSIRKGSRNIIESLKYSLDLLMNRDNLVLIFPQGEIQTLYTRDFKFEKGIEYLVKHLPRDKFDIFFNVNLVDYFSNKKPSLNIYFCKYEDQSLDLGSIQECYNRYYTNCIRKQVDV